MPIANEINRRTNDIKCEKVTISYVLSADRPIGDVGPMYQLVISLQINTVVHALH